jgi:TolA-binding protein
VAEEDPAVAMGEAVAAMSADSRPRSATDSSSGVGPGGEVGRMSTAVASAVPGAKQRIEESQERRLGLAKVAWN